MRYFVGVDWAKATHAVCVIDEDGQVVMRLAIDHTAEGLTQLVTALRRSGISPNSGSPSSDRAVCWSTRWSQQASWSTRSTPTW